MEIDEDIEIDPNAPIHIRMELARKKMFRDFERKNRADEAEIAKKAKKPKKTRKPKKPKTVKPKPVAPRTGKHRKTIPEVTITIKKPVKRGRKPKTVKPKPVAPRTGKHRKILSPPKMVEEKPKKRKIGDKATPEMLKKWDNMGLPTIPRSKQPKDKKPFRTFVKLK